MFELGNTVACIAEGGAERAVIDILLDNHFLVFEREMLIDEMVLRCRSAETFEKRYLGNYDPEMGKITVFRILDSRRENFKLSKAYQHRVDVVNVVTAPEIEMLIIFAEGQYKHFKKTKMKPNEFCKAELHYSHVKTYDFVKSYFGNPSVLVEAMFEYKSISKVKRGEYTLVDLLRTNVMNVQ